MSVCLHVCMWYVHHMCNISGACGGQKRVLDALELELWVVMNHMWCWEPNPGPVQKQLS